MDVKSAGRVLDLFEAFAELRASASASQLASHLRIPVSSCFKLLRTVEARGYLYSPSASQLYPTRKLLRIAEEIFENDQLSRLSPILAALSQETRETVCLAKRRDLHVVYLDVHECEAEIRFTVPIGTARDLHANSIGKAIMGSLDRAELNALLDRLTYERFTDTTITNREALYANLALGRERGWYSTHGDRVADAFSMAMPLRVNGEWYGVSIVGPRYRMEPALDRYADALRSAMAQIAVKSEQ